MSNVRLHGLTKTFPGGVRAVDEIDLEIAAGELLVLLGPSGCGKTTLLRCLAGLEHPDRGRITMDDTVAFDSEGGSQVATHKRDIGMVFQNYALWPHMTVLRNVAYPLRSRGVRPAEAERRAREALELVECDPLADRYPSAISGGQQQRVALARAVVAEPQLMLFDEPLSNLDYRLRGQMRDEIRAVHRQLGFTGVYVTHDQTEALQLGTRIAVMEEGRIRQIGSPEQIFGRPATVYVAEFLGIENRLPLVGSAGGGWAIDSTAVAVSGVPACVGGRVQVFARAGDVTLAPGRSEDTTLLQVPGARVVDRFFGGEITEWLVDVGGRRLRAACRTGAWEVEVGATVHLQIPCARALFYDDADALLAAAS